MRMLKKYHVNFNLRTRVFNIIMACSNWLYFISLIGFGSKSESNEA